MSGIEDMNTGAPTPSAERGVRPEPQEFSVTETEMADVFQKTFDGGEVVIRLPNASVHSGETIRIHSGENSIDIVVDKVHDGEITTTINPTHKNITPQ